MYAISIYSVSFGLLLVLCSSCLSAAEVRMQGRHLVIEGEIEKGDYDRFESLVRKVGVWSSGTVMLGSSGGDLLEAMKIGRLVRELRLSTSTSLVVGGVRMDVLGIENPNNSHCSSSCFYIFVGGISRFGNVLGIHRPYLHEETYKSMQVDDAIDASSAIRQLVQSYFEEMGVPASYVDRSFAVASDGIEWLGAEEVESFFAFDIDEIDEWLTARCPKYTEAESLIYFDEDGPSLDSMSPAEQALWKQANQKFQDIADCKANLREQMFCQAWYKKFAPTCRDCCPQN